MSINFAPPRGRILICDYTMARVPPEMDKIRRVVVVSPNSYNRRHRFGYGRCLVVPFSTTVARDSKPAHIHFPVGPYQSLTENTWAFCDVMTNVSHERLSQVAHASGFLTEELTAQDMLRIQEGIKYAAGLVET